jgi:hypothetical protein
LPVRRILEAAARTLPWFALLFVPIALGVDRLYEWAHAQTNAADALLHHKRPYLNTTFFLVRAVLYFAVWIGAVRVQDRLSAARDRSDAARLGHRQRTYAAFAMVLYGLTMTFAAIDWAMSLEPHWFSTIYGVIFIVGQVLAALAFLIAVLILLSRTPPLVDVINASHFHALGKLLLAFVMLWAYVSFSQYLIIWAGNLPEEIPWYLRRVRGGWRWIAVGIMLLHFALPFALLLFRGTKENTQILVRIALLLLAMRIVDTFWMITPAFAGHDARLYAVELLLFVGLGGAWVAMFIRQLKSGPILPPNDPRLAAATAGGDAAH